MDNVNKTIIGKPVLVDNKKIGVVVDFKEEDGIGIATMHINKSSRKKMIPMTLKVESRCLKNNRKNAKWRPNEI